MKEPDTDSMGLAHMFRDIATETREDLTDNQKRLLVKFAQFLELMAKFGKGGRWFIVGVGAISAAVLAVISLAEKLMRMGT